MPRFRAIALAAALALLACAAGAAAPPDKGETAQGETAQDKAAQDKAAQDKARRENDLKAIEEALSANAESRRRMEGEIAALRSDRAQLHASLIATAEKMRATEERIGALERRLETLEGSEGAIRRSLEARRGVLVEVLAALQRMGRRPPPAVLVRPEDMLKAVRTSMLLGAVLPELRAETEALAADLAERLALKRAIAADRATLARELAGLEQDRGRLDALVAARQNELAQAEKTFGGERQKAAELATQARTLKELIDRMERDGGASRAAEEARLATEAQTRERFAALALRDPARLAPKVPFADARGLLPKPVSGVQARDFGVSDGYGGTTRGISITTRPKAVVVSPADGWVAFAGPFRSFGRLLIINAGGGYYLLLAGMDHINVEVGQFVLAGEPVAVMGETSSLSPAAGAIETSDPVLYVEFRKDGGSIDPGPWWAKSQGEKVRG